MTTPAGKTARRLNAVRDLNAFRDARENIRGAVIAGYAARMSQVEIAHESGLSRQWVSRIIADYRAGVIGAGEPGSGYPG